MTTTTAAAPPDLEADHLQRREFLATVARAAGAGTDQRMVRGLAVPYDQETELVPGYFESFAPGACRAPDDEATKLFWRHVEPIGRVAIDAQTDAGWDVEARVSATPRGDEALVLVDDAVVTRMSVGFKPIAWETDEREDGTVHVRITDAVVPEVSLVPFPAYSGAAVTGRREDHQHATTTHPREKDTTMPETQTTEDEQQTRAADQAIAELRQSIDELRQAVAVRSDDDAETQHRAAEQFASHGAYLRAVATGQDEALALYERAVTSADTIARDSWVGNAFRLIQERQRIARFFTHVQNLPSTGNNVEYGVLASNTTQVDVQALEGDDLAYGEVKLTTDTAPVVTVGGYTELTRQAIERSSIEYLDTAMSALTIAYARRVELQARATLDAGIAAGTPIGTAVDLNTATADTWLDVLLDGDEALDNAGHAIGGMIVSKSVFRHLAHLPAESKLLKWEGTPDQHGGTLQVVGASGQLATVPIVVNPGWGAVDQAVVADPFAIVTREAPGAPFRLQDANVVNLTNPYSVYGYMASYTQAPAALAPVTVTSV